MFLKPNISSTADTKEGENIPQEKLNVLQARIIQMDYHN